MALYPERHTRTGQRHATKDNMNKTEKQKRYIARKTRHEKKRAQERKLMKSLAPNEWAKRKLAIKKRLEAHTVNL